MKGKDFSNESYLGFRKNIVHVSVGIPSGNVFYERILNEAIETDKTTLFIRGGYGMYANWAFVQEYYILEGGMFFGLKPSHLEFSLGAILLNNYNSGKIQPAGSIGYWY